MRLLMSAMCPQGIRAWINLWLEKNDLDIWRLKSMLYKIK